MTFDQLRRDFTNIDFNNIGSWPVAVKGLAVLLVAILVALGGYYFLTQKAIEELNKVQKEELTLRDVFAAKSKKAVNLEVYRQQLRDMEQTFTGLRQQLPDSTQVPDLLVEITQAGLGHGLEFELFQPGNERPAEFYAELPINILVSGSYHDIAQFASDVAGFARIVTLHDLAIKSAGEGTQLKMTGVAKTYRYIEEEE